MPRKDAEHSGVMDEDAERLRARMKRLDISAAKLSREAKARGHSVDRDTIGAILNGQNFRRESLTKLELTLAELEEESGVADMPTEPPDEEAPVVEFEIYLPGDPDPVRVIARGKDPVQVEEAVAGLLRRLRSEGKT